MRKTIPRKWAIVLLAACAVLACGIACLAFSHEEPKQCSRPRQIDLDMQKMHQDVQALQQQVERLEKKVPKKK